MTGAGPTAGSDSAPELGVIIPAYNEQQRLPQHVGHVLDYLRAHYPNFQLIVVDDGSRDQTVAAVQTALAGEPRARLLSYQPNRGKGYAVRTGVLACSAERILFLDADLSTPIEEAPRALAGLEQADIVVGSRDLPASEIRVPQPIFRRLASELFKWTRRLMVGLWRVQDTQCGFKAYRGPIAHQLFAQAQVDRFMFDVEILYLAERAGLRIAEMPVRWDDTPGSTVKMLAGFLEMLRDLYRIRRLHKKL